ncbi:MAG: DUF975 family protein [Oscillospiraceae bacterium]|jgi:uncharacterized membrane protein|nr:DUF975 family protein [Oscillospiraceae bacterium]
MPIYETKRGARLAIRNGGAHPFIATLALSVFSAVMLILGMRASGIQTFLGYSQKQFTEITASVAAGDVGSVQAAIDSGEFRERFVSEFRRTFSPAGFALMTVLQLFVMIAEFGASWYWLRLASGEKAKWTSLFACFQRAGALLLLLLYTELLVLLWTLPFIAACAAFGFLAVRFSAPALSGVSILFACAGMVAAVVANLRYAFAVFIMHDNPEFRVAECVRQSVRLIRGNKGRLFLLKLSFIGWYVLAGIVAAYLGFDVLALWITPYAGISVAVFYLFLRNTPTAELESMYE